MSIYLHLMTRLARAPLLWIKSLERGAGFFHVLLGLQGAKKWNTIRYI